MAEDFDKEALKEKLTPLIDEMVDWHTYEILADKGFGVTYSGYDRKDSEHASYPLPDHYFSPAWAAQQRAFYSTDLYYFNSLNMRDDGGSHLGRRGLHAFPFHYNE
jgi:hypothetical protein